MLLLAASLVQALLVLGGEEPQSRPRSCVALHYYTACCVRGQAVPYLVLSGAGGGGGEPSEAAGMAAYLLARGVAPAHVLQEPLACSTLANVVLGGLLAARHGWAGVGLVSDAFHLPRALFWYERVWGRAPALCLSSGVRGSAYLRWREKAVLAWQLAALRRAGVAPGDWRAHLAFVSPGLACPQSVP